MEEFREASPLAGSPASAAAFMEVAVSTAVAAEAFTAAAEVTAAEATGNSVRSHKRD
jgi:predicted lipoprotein with Yx(FWY)xxD motif